MVVLGLYRLPGANDNKYPYVYSNPDPKLNITIRDRVFVLGKHIPRDLIIDFNHDNLGGPAMNKEKDKKHKSHKESQGHNFYGGQRFDQSAAAAN